MIYYNVAKGYAKGLHPVNQFITHLYILYVVRYRTSGVRYRHRCKIFNPCFQAIIIYSNMLST